MPGMNIPEAQALPSLRPYVAEDVQALERASNYKLWKVSLPFVDQLGFGSFSRVAPVIKASGDHLTVISVEGPHELGIAVNRGNDYLPIAEGTVITRQLSEISVKAFSFLPPLGVVVPTPSDANTNALTTVTFATSWGPLWSTPFRFVTGLQGQFPMGGGVAGITGVRIMDIFNGPENNVPIEVLKRGGTMLIRNSGAVDMYLYWGNGGDFNPGGSGVASLAGAWIIPAGGVLTLEARSRLSQRVRADGLQFVTLCLASSAGNCAFNVIVSSWGDASELESNTGGSFAFRTDLGYGKP